MTLFGKDKLTLQCAASGGSPWKNGNFGTQECFPKSNKKFPSEMFWIWKILRSSPKTSE